ncbi:MAG: PD-(D/E)XK nuclease family protein [Spirochaetia bacterium]
MTITTLSEIEACPRRWALAAAEYPELWSGHGYPPRLQLSALVGTIVHLALQTITRKLVQAACSSVQDQNGPKVMKELGGYTKVVHDCIDRVLHRFTNNPRALPLLESANRSLRARTPELRTRIQTMLCRVRLPPLQTVRAEMRESKLRAPLTIGAFTEIELRATHIGWKGKADMLVLSDETCEITDVKTGMPEERHQFQVQVYALLWCRDEELNPNHRRADRLVLRYSDEDVQVAAPTAVQLEEIERNIVARRDAALQTASQRPPEARPNRENCRYCGVRHLCDKYWTPETQFVIGADQRFTDAEVSITGRHGPSSWDAVVKLSAHSKAGTRAVLRTHHELEFRVNDCLRIIEAAIAGGDDEQPVVFTLFAVSEVYSVRSGGTATKAS